MVISIFSQAPSLPLPSVTAKLAGTISKGQSLSASSRLNPAANNKSLPASKALLYALSALVLVACFYVQSYLHGAQHTTQSSIHISEPTLDPFGDSVYRQEAYFEELEPGTECRPKSVFSQELAITPKIQDMALEAEAKRMAAEFDFTKDDLNKGVQRFIEEMNDGLEKFGGHISQIPTYVTSVPNGTEKVRLRRCRDK